MSLQECIAEQEQWEITKSQKLLKATKKGGSCGEQWSPI